jgi:tetrahydromethanopterin S-methyltransferase subunit B
VKTIPQLLLAGLLLFVAGITKAQDPTPLEQGSMNEQFTYVITKTEAYEDYQVIKRHLLYKLKNNALDTIKYLQDQRQALSSQVNKLQSEVEVLNTTLKDTSNELATVKKEKNSMRLFGLLMPKGTYYLVIGFIFLVLLAALGIVFLMYKRSNAVTLKTKETLTNIQEEFDRHRKWALENEKKLSRELMKEKNKGKGLI